MSCFSVVVLNVDSQVRILFHYFRGWSKNGQVTMLPNEMSSKFNSTSEILTSKIAAS